MKNGITVMASGVFDIVHLGHIHYLEEAKSYGDKLVVVIARDQTVLKFKGRYPINSEKNRMELIANLKMVNETVLGHLSDMYQTVEDIKPDVIVLGYDQTFNESELEKECLKRGIVTKVVRASPRKGDFFSTSKIIKKILNIYC
ncbi:MAG: adenylyltransferase/cytidyltransferase family protein [Thermoplasmata archaeon]